MLLSDNDANIEPKASSTSGNETIVELEAELGIESSDPEEGIELCDSSEGREGNDGKGGDRGESCIGSNDTSSSIGRDTSGLNGEKSRSTSMMGEDFGGESNGIFSISSMWTASSNPPDNFDRRGGALTHAPENSSATS